MLEIGCGPGVALADAARRASAGFAAGVDPSAVMVAQARRRCRAAIAAGRAEVRQAPAAAFPTRTAASRAPSASTRCRTGPRRARGWPRCAASSCRSAWIVIALRKQRQGAGVDPHAHGATSEQVAPCAPLLELGFTDVEAPDHEFGRETLVTIVAAVPSIS